MRRDTSARVRTLQLPWTSRTRTAPASGPATRRRRSDPRAPARRARPALAAAARGRSRPPRSRGGPARPEVLEVAVEPERPFVSLVGIVVRLIRELDSAAGGDLEVEDVYELHARRPDALQVERRKDPPLRAPPRSPPCHRVTLWACLRRNGQPSTRSSRA